MIRQRMRTAISLFYASHSHGEYSLVAEDGAAREQTYQRSTFDGFRFDQPHDVSVEYGTDAEP